MNIYQGSCLPPGILLGRIMMMEPAMAGICGTEVLGTEETGDIDRLIAEAITFADGDLPRIIRALLLGQHEIEAEKIAQVSFGYVRRGLY